MSTIKSPIKNSGNNGLLKFSLGNAKLSKDTAIFSTPAGHSCPGAHDCQSKADRDTGQITDGKHMLYRCFAASQEAAFPNVRKARWHNFDLLKAARTRNNIRTLILDSLPPAKKWSKMRIHASGDFFSMAYFQAWIDVAEKYPDKVFYAYSKSGSIIGKYFSAGGVLPKNLVLTGSNGGKHDYVWKDNGVKMAYVVSHPESTDLPVDHDDSLAYVGEQDFALLLHGVQPQGSQAAKDITRMKEEGISFSYSK